jgi:oligopeptide/dipeptide ABC transporter ATP-binding protein
MKQGHPVSDVMTPPTQQVMLEVQNLSKRFTMAGSNDHVHAVSDVNFCLQEGKTLSLVGESGCGKTTLGRLVLRLLEPSQGSVHLQGQDLSTLTPAQLRSARARMQVVFQNPFASLNPRMKVETILARPMRIHLNLSARARRERVGQLLEQVGLRDEHRDRYPHEFSGGQRQRIAIARALAANARLLVFDEPTSALDVSVQAQILNLIKRLQQELNLTYLFISHDLSTVRHISDRVAVMYLGRIVELADTEALFSTPKHPYSKALLSAIPVSHPRLRRERIRLSGDIPSPINVPSGCAFRSRCPWAEAVCQQERPLLREVDGQQVACHLAESLEPQ